MWACEERMKSGDVLDVMSYQDTQYYQQPNVLSNYVNILNNV